MASERLLHHSPIYRQPVDRIPSYAACMQSSPKLEVTAADLSACELEHVRASDEGVKAQAHAGRKVMSGALLLLLLGTLAVLILVFQPFANAGGGCGGG